MMSENKIDVEEKRKSIYFKLTIKWKKIIK